MKMTIAALRRESVTMTDEPVKLRSAGTTMAFIEDPDGTLIELITKH